MSNDAIGGCVSVRAHTHDIQITSRNGMRAPSVWIRQPRMPHMAQVERHFPFADRSQIQEAMDVAEDQINARLLDTLDDTLSAMFGPGIHLYLGGECGYIIVEGLGNPHNWNAADNKIFKTALVRTCNALRTMASPRAIVARIRRNGIPAMRQTERSQLVTS